MVDFATNPTSEISSLMAMSLPLVKYGAIYENFNFEELQV